VAHNDRILEFVRSFPGRDDDQIAATLDIRPRQTVNQICRALSVAGKIERRPNASGKIGNFPAHSAPNEPPASPYYVQEAAMAPPVPLSATQEWFWEGNVATSVSQYLLEHEWKILSLADTRTRERGLDIHAIGDGHELVIEVKGYPSRSYRDQKRATERKPTSPTLQAQHWYSHAFLKAVRLQSSYPKAIVALAFPDFPKYRLLFAETANACQTLKIGMLFVSNAGQIETIGL
jgi:hypothetical protein